MYKTEIVTNISENLQKELNDFSDKNWGEHVHPGDIANQFFAIPTFAVIALEHEKIIGLLFVFVRDIFFEKKKYSLGGVGGVVVDKNSRGKGVATSILKLAINEMTKRKVDVSMLCTDLDRLGKLYEGVGFVRLGRNYYFVGKKGETEVETGGMIRGICSKQAFETILNSKSDLNVGVSNF